MAYNAIKNAQGNYEVFQNGQRVTTGSASILGNYGLSESNLGSTSATSPVAPTVPLPPVSTTGTTPPAPVGSTTSPAPASTGGFQGLGGFQTGQPTAPAASTAGSSTLPGFQPTSDLTAFRTTLDQVSQLAKQKRNELSLKFMMPFSGTVAASDFNSILSNLNSASDTTTRDLTNRAVEQQTNSYSTMTDSNGNVIALQLDSTGRPIGQQVIYNAPPRTANGWQYGTLTDPNTGDIYQTQSDPTTGQVVGQQLLFKGNKNGGYTLNPGETKYDANNQLVATAPTAAQQNATGGYTDAQKKQLTDNRNALIAAGVKDVPADTWTNAPSTPVSTGQPTATIQEYNIAVGQGYKGTLLDYQTALKNANTPAPSQADKTATVLASYSSAFTPGKTINGVPTIDSDGYATPEAWKAAIAEAPGRGLPRADFIKQFGYLIINQGGTVSPKYGLTPAELKLLGIDNAGNPFQ